MSDIISQPSLSTLFDGNLVKEVTLYSSDIGEEEVFEGNWRVNMNFKPNFVGKLF